MGGKWEEEGMRIIMMLIPRSLLIRSTYLHLTKYLNLLIKARERERRGYNADT